MGDTETGPAVDAGKRLDTVFGAYDIRGDARDALCCGNVIAIARAYGDFISPEGDRSFVIGHDARVTSRSLAEAVSLGLRSGGHHVTHIGLCTTPMLYWYGAAEGFDGSVMITASDLAPEYNGLKLCRAGAMPLSAEDGLAQVRRLVRLPFVFDRPCTPVLQRARPLAQYAAVMRARIEAPRPVKVVVDAGNGPGGLDTREVFSHLPYVRLWEISFEPDGGFPDRSPDPSAPGALMALARCVVRHGCELGVAYDGDADRIAVVDERGETVPADVVGALVARRLLARHGGGVVLCDPRAGRGVAEAVEEAGGRALRTRVGRPYIKAAMRAHEALFALEMSGHYYYSDLYCSDNGLRTLIELINVVAGADAPLSELARGLRRYARAAEMNVAVGDSAAALEALARTFADGKIDRIEGITVDYPDWWFNARAALTEPVLRINVEARDESRLEDRRARLLGVLRAFRSDAGGRS